MFFLRVSNLLHVMVRYNLMSSLNKPVTLKDFFIIRYTRITLRFPVTTAYSVCVALNYMRSPMYGEQFMLLLQNVVRKQKEWGKGGCTGGGGAMKGRPLVLLHKKVQEGACRASEYVVFFIVFSSIFVIICMPSLLINKIFLNE